MLSVNITLNTTEAYIQSSIVTEKTGTPGVLDTTVKATDDSGIVAIAGAVGRLDEQHAIGAAIGYNEIDNDVLAYLDDVDLTDRRLAHVEATSDGEIGGVAVGVAVATGATASSPAPARS